MRARDFTQGVTNFVRNRGRDRDAPIVMMTNPRNRGARTASNQRISIEDFPLKTVAVAELQPWEPMIKMQDLPSQRTVASLIQTLRQGGRIPPLLVTPVRDGYRIIDGHHRYAALQRAGIDRVAVRVVDPRLIRYSDEVLEALRITMRRYGKHSIQEDRTATVELDGGERRQVRWVPGRNDMLDMIIAYYWRQGRRVLKVDDHDIDWDDDSEVIKQPVAEGRISDLDIDLQDQRWEAVVGFVQDGVRRGRDADRMSIDLYRWAGGEQFDVDEELERRGFRSVTDLADHIREHGGRYVPPEFDLSGAASLRDIERLGRRRDSDVSENFADGRNSAKNEFRPVIDMLEVGYQDIAEWLEERPQLLESLDGWKDARSLMSRISSDRAEPGESYAILNLIIVPTGNFLIQRGLRSPARLLRINDLGTYQQYEFESQGQILKFPEDYRAGGQLSRTFLFLDPRDLEKTQTLVALSLAGWEIRDRIDENFADGRVKGKSRPGRVKRAGASCKGSVSDLRARAKKYSGEKGKMYQWCLNMKAGKQKKSK
jgi:hypothetical protein